MKIDISLFEKPIKFKNILELQKVIDNNYIRKENFKNGFVSMSLIKNIIEFNENTPNNHFYYEKDRVFNKEKADKKIGEIFSNIASFINSIYEEKLKENDPEKNFHIFMMLKRIEKDFDESFSKIGKEDTLLTSIIKFIKGKLEYSFTDLLKTFKEYSYSKDEILDLYFDFWKIQVSRINKGEI